MRAVFTKFGRSLSSIPQIRGRRTVRSTVRQLACEPLAERCVLSATPLMDIAMAEEAVPEMTCAPALMADPAFEAALQEMAANHSATTQSNMASHPTTTTASFDAAFAEMGADAMFPVAATSPVESAAMEATLTDPEFWMGPTVPVAFNESIASDTFLDPTELEAYSWNSPMTPEGEYSEPAMAGMTDMAESTEMIAVAGTDPWDDPLEGTQTGNFSITSFTARSVAGGWMLEGQISWTGSMPSDLVVHFGGLAEGHTATAYSDGQFFYYISFPSGWFGTVTATAYDRDGSSSANASVQIWV